MVTREMVDLKYLAEIGEDLNDPLPSYKKIVKKIREMKAWFYITGLERMLGWDESVYEELEIIPLKQEVLMILAQTPDPTDHLLKRDSYAIGVFHLGDVKIVRKKEYYNGNEPEKSYTIRFEVPNELFEWRKVGEVCRRHKECVIKLLRKPLRL